MALDRFVDWKSTGPSMKDVKTVLEDYLGGAAVGRIRVSGDHLSVRLAGNESFRLSALKGGKI